MNLHTKITAGLIAGIMLSATSPAWSEPQDEAKASSAVTSSVKNEGESAQNLPTQLLAQATQNAPDTASEASPAPDPRDEEIRRLRQELDDQKEEIRQLRALVESMLPPAQAKAAKGQAASQKNPYEKRASEPSADEPNDTELETEQSGLNGSETGSSAESGTPAQGFGDTDSAEAGDSETSNGEDASNTAGDTPEAEENDPGPAPPTAADAPIDSADASASGQQPEMNPNISVVLLGGAKAGGAEDDDTRNSLYLQEAELAIGAPVDPNTRADLNIGVHHGESPELEEAYATYMGLPGGLQLRGGLLHTEFGRLNTVHTHALPQIDQPLPLNVFLGEHGITTPGAEISWLTPLPWYSKAIVSVGTRYGEHHHHHEHEHEEGGEEEEEEEHEFSLFPTGGSKNLLTNVRWENMADLNDDTTLMVGLSHASSSINNDEVRASSISGADLTLKWKPKNEQYKSLVWQTEYMTGEQTYVDPERPRKAFQGWYTFLNYRFDRHWGIGARYDEADVPSIENGHQKRYTALVEYIANEWNSLRLQYNHCDPNYQKSFDEVMLQWNISIGPHGAHKY
ncbi:MAG: hypothetical protein K6G50_06975 [bacterium]|nr:hypothetical protein [bacterium]